MTWEHRIICDDTGSLRIAEIYTDLPHVPGNMSWTADPIAPVGEHPDELKRELELMLRAFGKPVLDEVTLRETVASRITKR